jgi:hypothetical protein
MKKLILFSLVLLMSAACMTSAEEESENPKSPFYKVRALTFNTDVNVEIELESYDRASDNYSYETTVKQFEGNDTFSYLPRDWRLVFQGPGTSIEVTVESINGNSDSCVAVGVFINNTGLEETEVACGSNASARISIPREYF